MTIKTAALVLCLLCVGVLMEFITASAVHALGGSIKYQTTNVAVYGRDKQPRWVEPESDATIKLALARLNDLGYIAIIDEIGGSYKTILKAIAIHESGGGIKLENKKSGALCAFQVMPANIRAIAKQQHVDPDILTQRLRVDKRYCVELGLRFLKEAIASRGSLELGLCQYNGQISMLKDLKWCWAVEEYTIMSKSIDGTRISEIVTDKTSPDFTDVVHKDEGGAVIGTTLNCHDRTETLAKALNKMSDNYKIYTSGIREEVYYDSIRQQASQKESPIPSAKKLMCIDDITAFMDMSRGLMKGVKALDALFSYIVKQVLDAACNWAIDNLVTPIENFMDSICLPIPDLSYSMSMKSVKRKGCNGVSLGQALVESGAGLTPQDIQNGMHNLYSMSGVPAINSIPSFSWQTPSFAAPLRAIFGSANPGVKQ